MVQRISRKIGSPVLRPAIDYGTVTINLFRHKPKCDKEYIVYVHSWKYYKDFIIPPWYSEYNKKDR